MEMSAVEIFSKTLGYWLSDATVHNFRREVLHQVKERNDDMDEIVIQLKKKSRPLLLPEEINELTKKYSKN